MAYGRRRHDIEMVVTNFIAYIHMAVICLLNFDRLGLWELAGYTESRAGVRPRVACIWIGRRLGL